MNKRQRVAKMYLKFPSLDFRPDLVSVLRKD